MPRYRARDRHISLHTMSMTDKIEKNPLANSPIHWLRQTSPYINTHRGKTFVVWFSGSMIAAEGFTTLVHDLTLLSHLGIRLVLVHGMRAQIDAELQRRQIEPQYGTDSYSKQSMRITTTESIPAITTVTGEIRCQLESAFSTGLPNSPMSGAQISLMSGNLIVAKPYGIRDGIDYQHTGEIRKLRVQKIRTLLDAGMVVTLSPVGYSPTGEMFNLLSEDVAMLAAISIGADKLIYLHTEADSLADNLHEISAIDQQESNRQYSDTISSTIDRSKHACRNGVDRCHIVDANNPEALLQELFTRDGSGLLIDRGDYDNIRPADTNSVSGIMQLIKPLITDGTLANRTEQDLEREIHHFYITEREGSVICCASLRTNGNAAELSCLAVHPDFRASGKATEMLEHLVKAAQQNNCSRIFSLSTRTGDWFLEHGFTKGDANLLQQLQQTENIRGSKLYVLEI